MDGNCNIITEILLVISCITSYCKKEYYYSNYVTVTSYCPTLGIKNRDISSLKCTRHSNLIYRKYVFDIQYITIFK